MPPAETFLDTIIVQSLIAELTSLVALEDTIAWAVACPPPFSADAVANAVTRWLDHSYSIIDQESKTRRRRAHHIAHTVVSKPNRDAFHLVREGGSDRHWLIFVAEHLVTERMRIATDRIITCTIDIDVVQQAAAVFDQQIVAADDAAFITGMDHRDIAAYFRAGRSITETVAKIRTAGAGSAPPADKSAPKLEDLHGFGAARDWGLELAIDLADWTAGKIGWNDVDRGILLSGPPGCGKTTFASALARSCGVTFIPASYAQWQSAGHQGDMLKVMKQTFKEASEKAPCVLLIDEIDSFADRNAAHGDNASYVRGVVNGFLEHLDGSGGREGVIVIGACNDPDILDPAIKRAGRLDRHVEIGLPDAQGRLGILTFHMGAVGLETPFDLADIVALTEGLSGADLERIVRDARRTARRDRRPISIADLTAACPTPVTISAVQQHCAAIHEIGHAIVGAILDVGEIKAISIVQSVLPQQHQSLGHVRFKPDPAARHTMDSYKARIAMLLSGMAAEQLIFGAHDHGVVADLEQATQLAAFALGAVGMGDHLASVGDITSIADVNKIRTFDPKLGRDINGLLRSEADRARKILERNKQLLLTLADELYRDKTLDPSILYAAIDSKTANEDAASNRVASYA